MTQAFVTPARLQEHLDDPGVVIVDGSWYLPNETRDPEAEFLASHIPGALRFDIDDIRDTGSALPHMLPSPETFAARAGAMGIANDTIVIVYDGSGLFSAARVRWMFRIFGTKDVRILEGGFPAWVAEERPVESGPARIPEPKIFTPTFDPSVVVAAEGVQRALASGEAQVVDARPAARFRGEAPEPRPGVRPGHMPGSINLPFPELIENGTLKDKASLAKTLSGAGIDPERPIIASCGSGVSAAIVALALETTGHPAKAIYDGSWADWGSRTDLPVATGPSKA